MPPCLSHALLYEANETWLKVVTLVKFCNPGERGGWLQAYSDSESMGK